MKQIFLLIGLVSVLAIGLTSMGCDNDDENKNGTVDVSTLPQACQDLAPLCDACS